MKNKKFNNSMIWTHLQVVCKIYPLIILREMKITESKTLIVLLIILGFVFTNSYYLNIKNIHAQTYDKVIPFPDVNIIDNKTQNNSLDQEFILIINNEGNNSQNTIEILNPDFGLNPPFVKLVEGQRYTINPVNSEDIRYSNITVKLAQVISVSPDIKIQDANPEDPSDMTLGGQIEIAYFDGGKGGVFVIPPNLIPGKYILYTYIQYPYGITGVFSNLATMIKR